MSDIIGKYLTVQGIRTHYEAAGNGGPAVLLIHTAGRDNRQWHGVIDALAPHCRLFAPDLPGHGKSWPGPDNTCLQSVEEISDWLLTFMECVAGSDFLVMGCSLGGNLALLLPARSSRVRGAVALQGADYTPGFSEAALDLMVHPKNNLMFSNMDFTMSLVGRDADPNGRKFIEWGILSINPLAQQGDLRAYARCDARAVMPNVTCPILILRGEDDWVVSQDMCEATLNRLGSTNKKLRILKGLGHFPHVEAPQTIARHFLSFMETLDAGKSAEVCRDSEAATREQ